MNISLVIKIIKKNRSLCILFREMSRYNGYSDSNKRVYFMTKDETMFDKYVTTWEKVSNIIKKQQ